MARTHSSHTYGTTARQKIRNVSNHPSSSSLKICCSGPAAYTIRGGSLTTATIQQCFRPCIHYLLSHQNEFNQFISVLEFHQIFQLDWQKLTKAK